MGSTFNESPIGGARKRSLTESLIHDFLSQMNQMVANEDLRAIGVSLENFHETYDTPEVQAYVIENPDESHEIDECVQKAQKLVSTIFYVIILGCLYHGIFLLSAYVPTFFLFHNLLSSYTGG